MPSSSLAVEAKIANISVITDYIDATLPNIDKQTKTRMYIAADEVFSNIVRHGRLSESATVNVGIAVDKNNAAITFTDCGVVFNPLKQADLYTAPSSADDDVHGLGAFVLVQIADCVEYRRHGNTNILTITFALTHYNSIMKLETPF